MNNKNELTRMEEALRNDEELSKKFDEAIKRIAKSGEAKSDGEVMVKAAAELGFSITIEDLERATAASQELSDDELDMVAGGGVPEDDQGHDTTCFSLWHCYTITCHTETTSHNEPCWKNYMEHCWSNYSCFDTHTCLPGYTFKT